MRAGEPRMRRVYPQGTKSQIIAEMHDRGEALEAIAARVGWRLASVRNELSKLNRAGRLEKAKPQAKCARTLDIMARYRAGVPAEAIGAALGICARAVRTVVGHQLRLERERAEAQARPQMALPARSVASSIPAPTRAQLMAGRASYARPISEPPHGR